MRLRNGTPGRMRVRTFSAVVVICAAFLVIVGMGTHSPHSDMLVIWA